MEEKEAETAIEIGIEGTEIGMEIEGQVEDGRIEMTGEIEDEKIEVEMIEVEMIEEGHRDLEEMKIEDTEEIPDGEEMMIGETGTLR